MKALKVFFDNALDIMHTILIFVNTIYFLKGPNPDNKIKCCDEIANRGIKLFKFYISKNMGFE